jgi:vacuolar-type H+-ATPase subunit I/STV1
MVDQRQIYTLIAVAVPTIIMLTMAVLSYIHSRRLGDDVLRSRMFLKAHLLRRGYFIFILAAVGMFLVNIPVALDLDLPILFHAVMAVFVLTGLALGTLHFYLVVAPRKSQLSVRLSRLFKSGGDLKGHGRRNLR